MHLASARLTPTPQFKPPPVCEKHPETQAAFSSPKEFPLGWLWAKRHPP